MTVGARGYFAAETLRSTDLTDFKEKCLNGEKRNAFLNQTAAKGMET